MSLIFCVSMHFRCALMNFDDSFPNRVSIARTALGLTQDELAQKVGVVRRQIAAYEGGEAKPRINALQNLAAALGTTTSWLTSGVGDGPDVSNVKKTITVPEIPVLSHVHSFSFEAEDFISSSSIIDFIPAPPGAHEKCFALEISGDSMSTDSGDSFPHGTIVTFDPDKEPKSGDYVICWLNDTGENTFKQLILDQGQPYLRALNNRYYPVIRPTPLLIMGVAIHSQRFLNKKTHLEQISMFEDDRWAERENSNSQKHLKLIDRIKNLEEKMDLILNFMQNKNR